MLRMVIKPPSRKFSSTGREIADDEITGKAQDQLALRTRTAPEGTGR
jgi:hypothetical protein